MVRPWNPRMVAMMPGLPVDIRANLMAASIDSAPELHKKTRSNPSGAISASLDMASARLSL